MSDINSFYLIVGALGLATAAAGVYVFTLAARRYVSSDDDNMSAGEPSSYADSRQTQGRSSQGRDERRSDRLVAFPLMIDGVLIPKDRRQQ